MRLQVFFTFCILTCGADATFAADKRSFLGYSSLDIAFDGATASLGADYTLAPAGNGPVLRLQASHSLSRYSSPLAVSGMAETREQTARLMAGYALERNGLSLKLFAGLALHQRIASPAGADAATGLLIGPALAADMWWNVSGRAVVAGHALFAMPFQSWSLRLAPGWRSEFGPVLGPEIVAGGHSGTLRLQAGLHLTDLALGPFRARLSAGHALDPLSGANGPYGAFSAWKNF